MTMNEKDLVQTAKQQIISQLSLSATKAMEEGSLPQGEVPSFHVEIPADTTHGDFASNLAMVGAKLWRNAPQKIAQILLDHLSLENTYLERVEIAGPGFLNFFLKPEWFSNVVESVLYWGEDYGKTDYGQGKRVLVEFVSANPTGPMHLGNARGGVTGDCLASALDAAGYDAYREFYLNDAGNQIAKFGYSLEARYLQIYQGEDQVPFDETWYQGEDIKVRAQEFADKYQDQYVNSPASERQKALIDFALPLNINDMKETLHAYRVDYDNWFPESSLYQAGTVDKILEIFKEKGVTYELDGALWYRASDFGAEKDEVLVRQNGNPTYFAADIAYHYNKIAVRGFHHCIDFLGADHHGHVARLKGALTALGLNQDDLDIVLFQMVQLLKDGEPMRMSKRTGKSITLGDLLDMVPVDAARFFFNSRESGSTIDFDLDLAVSQTAQNPVYYVQYAHTRPCSVERRASEAGIVLKAPSKEELALLNSDAERELIRFLAQYPSTIIGATIRRDTACFTHYATSLAALYHKFYDRCPIIKCPEAGLQQARLALNNATRITLGNVLTLMRITAPETM